MVKRQAERGISLIESLLIVAILGSMVILIANFPNAISLVTRSQHTSLAREIAAKQLEDKRRTQYDNLATGSENITDTRLSLLPGGVGTIDVSACEISLCSNSEEVKKVVVSVNWQENHKPQLVKLETFIGEGGLDQP